MRKIKDMVLNYVPFMPATAGMIYMTRTICGGGTLEAVSGSLKLMIAAMIVTIILFGTWPEFGVDE